MRTKGRTNRWAAAPAAAMALIGLMAAAPAARADTFTVSQPEVRQPMTGYPSYTFRPGDVVTVDAGGGVQTGGHGRTWKRYVDPMGPNSDRLYHGLVWIPGATRGLVRIQSVIGKRLYIPANYAAPGPLFLRLGYEDDHYSDNGYYSHDDGWGDQCRGVGNAYVRITIERPDNMGGWASQCFLPPFGTGAGADADGDGIADAAEQALAERFAPVVVHDRDDPDLPCSVDWLLQRTALYFYHDNGRFAFFPLPDIRTFVVGSPTQEDLLGHDTTQGGQGRVYSDGTRSTGKKNTYLLYDVADPWRGGNPDTRDWRTYVHAYRNTMGGVTIQYWRCYSYNTGAPDLAPLAFDNHGGDWECVQVVLNRDLRPFQYRLPGHTGFEVVPANAVTYDGPGSDHVVVYSEPGGHATHVACDTTQVDHLFHHPFPNDLTWPGNAIRQETWGGGHVFWPARARAHAGGPVTPSGGLVNVGEKARPMNGQVFIRYSGLWGDHSRAFISEIESLTASGYWGPAFNETGLGADGFETAWAYGMRDAGRAEAYPDATCE